MENYNELYETIFCSQYGQENRAELLEKHKDKLPELRAEHEKSGLKINGKAIPFDDCIKENPLYHRVDRKASGDRCYSWWSYAKTILKAFFIGK